MPSLGLLHFYLEKDSSVNPLPSPNQRLLGSTFASVVRAEQVRILYQSAAILLVNLFTAPVAAAVLWQVYPAWVLLGWVGLIFVAVMARLALWRHFHRHDSSVEEAARWGRRFALGAVATGCLWGLLGSVVFVTADPTYYLFVAFVLGGMTAGASMRDSSYLPAFYGFAAPAILPMVIALVAKGSFALGGTGLLLAAFCAVLVLMGRDNNRRIIENIRLIIEQASANDELQRAMSDLKSEGVMRRQAAAALEESNERVQFANAIFAAQLEGSPDGIMVADQNRKIVLFNRRFGEMWRIPHDVVAAGSDEIVLNAATPQLKDPQRFYDRVIHLYDHPEEIGNEEIEFKDGRVFDRYSAPLYDANKKYLGRVWLFNDVTARKLAESALREREEELKEAQRVAHVGNWQWLLDTDTVEWSEELHRIFGHDPRLPAPSVAEQAHLFTAESFARLKAALTACREAGTPYEIDLEFLRPDGTTGWIAARGEPQGDAGGHIRRIRGTAHDVTARKLAEQKALEGEATFRSLVENGIAGISIGNEDATIAYVNPRLASMLGFEVANDLIGRSFLEFISKADEQSVGMVMETLFSGRKPTVEFALTLVPKRGSAINVLVQSSLTIFKGKRAAISVTLDISERREAEEKIRTLNEQMTANVDALRRHAQEMTLIGKLSDILQSCRSTAEAYPIVAMTAGKLFGDVNGALSLVVTGTHELETVVQWGADQTVLPSFYFDDCWALRTGQSYEVNGTDSSTPCHHFKSAPHGSYVCLPLMVHGETSGLLHVNIPANGVISEELHRLMLSFGDVVKLSLANLKLRELLSDQAMRDQLTALFNRHYLAETLPREIHRAQRDKIPLSVAMLDIDHFKQFNDTYGHDAGDMVLKELGAFLRASVRAGDIACRYGGEELLLILPECAIDEAHTRLTQICGEMKAKTIVFHGQALPSVTLSVGLAEMGDDLVSADTLITAADAALYAAKHNGRDRVEIFSREIAKAAPMAAA